MTIRVRTAKEVSQRIAYVTRYMRSISPNLGKWKELQQEKRELHKELSFIRRT